VLHQRGDPGLVEQHVDDAFWLRQVLVDELDHHELLKPQVRRCSAELHLGHPTCPIRVISSYRPSLGQPDSDSPNAGTKLV